MESRRSLKEGNPVMAVVCSVSRMQSPAGKHAVTGIFGIDELATTVAAAVQ